MKKIGVLLLAGMIVLAAVLIAGLGGTPSGGTSAASSSSSGQSLLAGRNVNMVSGTKLPFGDPWLQRQNEPSIAASTRNPLHLLAGANDYRTIDMPDDFKLPGIERTASADAWLGVYESFNGGESWITTLLPGFPQDASSEGQLSPLNDYETACDPIVRAGANGLFYYCGIAFNRARDKSALFVARYVDNNNLEKIEVRTDQDGTKKYFGPIQYIDTRLVATGSTSSSFIDMPNMAVDVPRMGALYGNVYVAYTVFSNTGGSSIADKIFFQRSTDGGVTWSAPPVQLSTTGEVVQRPIIAVDPIDLKGNTIYVAFRRFAKGNVPDGIVVVKSTNGGKTFSKLPDVSPSFYPFDQGTSPSPSSFRTNSYPTMAVGDLGTVYVAWPQRLGGPNGQARIMISALRKGGLVWSTPQVVDQTYVGIGHQFMPSLTFAAWRLMLAWYDQREDVALDALASIGDAWGATRHTIDVRAAEGRPGVPPVFSPSIQLSRYLHVLDLDANGNPIEEGGYNQVIQAEFNHINYPLFQLGTVPFHGDYLEVTPSVRILPPAVAFGKWIYNINPFEPTSFHTAWTDNRDVRPPNGDSWGDWVSYNAPGSIQDGWPYPAPSCLDGSKTGMRNQNIYTANINKGLIMGSPGNTKQLDLPLTGEGGRTFVVFVKNTTEFKRTLNLVIFQIGGVDASFDQFQNDDNIQVEVQPYSSVSCTIYLDRSTRKLAPVTVNAFEGLKLVGYAVLNPDPTNLPLSDPDNPFQDLGKETHDPDVSAPLVWNYDLGDESDPNASAVLGPRVQNPRVQNYSIVNPRVQNEGVLNPRVQNESIVNNEVPNPRVQNTAVPNGALTDVTWTVTNEGNTTSVFTTNIRSQYPDYFNGEDPPLIAQALVYKVHRVPVDKDCQLYESHQDELIANISNPRVQNPRVQNNPPAEGAGSTQSSPISIQAADLGAQDITFYLAPGEQAEVTFRVWDEDTTDGSPIFSPDMVIAEAAAEAVNTEDVEEGSTTPPSDVPPNSEPWTTPPPQIGVSPLSLSFGAFLGLSPADQLLTVWNSGGGALNYTVADDALWLSVTPTSGAVTPQDHTVSVDAGGLSAGIYTGTIIISDPYAANNPARVPVTFTITPAPPLSITTTSVPDGIRGTSYSVFLECSGGVGDVTWSVFAGSLPPGLNLETTEGGTCWIIGTPTAAGYFNFTVQAQDELPQAVTQPLSMTVADWVARHNGPASLIDRAYAAAVDPAGNIYVTGYQHVSETEAKYVTIKYNSSGGVVWTATYGMPETSGGLAEAIAVDALGNVYVTGGCNSSAGRYEYATVKYNSSGVEQWVARYRGPRADGSEHAYAIAVDALGNVYVTGESSGQYQGTDYATVKYDSAGVEQWAARYNGPGDLIDVAGAVAVDAHGNVYVTGYSFGANQDYATVKYNSAGVEQWAARYNGPGNSDDYSQAIALDASGHVYVTGFSQGSGTSSDYATVKYDSAGVEQWAARYNGPGNGPDSARALAIDGSGNICVTGYSAGLGSTDMATVKYTDAGAQLWVSRYDGPAAGMDGAGEIASDPLGNVYVSGVSGISAGDSYDCATVKYNAAGVGQWAARYDGPDHRMEMPKALEVDALGNIVVSGISAATASGEDLVTIRYVQSFPSTLEIVAGVLDDGLAGAPYAETVWAFGGSGTRQWHLGEEAILPPGLALNAATGIISGTPTTPGVYNFSVQVVDGALADSKSQSITVTAGAAAKIQVETQADGNGTVVPPQNQSGGSSLTVYAIARDASNNFIENVAADSWSLINKINGVVDGDLMPASDMKSATFTAHIAGSAQIEAAKGVLTPVSTGTLTALGPILLVNPLSRSVPFTAGTTSFPVSNTGTGTMSWTAMVSAGSPWLTMESGSSGTNDGTIVLAFTENFATADRFGIIWVTATGAWGNPRSLLVTQAGIAALSVTPADAFTSSGPAGGPFTPSSKVYTLHNTGGTALNWAAEAGELQTLSASSGTLAAGASADLTVSVSPQALSRPAGTYSYAVTLLNMTNGVGNTTRPCSLTITSGPLDHFEFNVLDTWQPADLPISITITAKDSLGNTVTSYAGTNALTADAGTLNRYTVDIVPTSTGAFVNGVWIGSVTFYLPDTDAVQIHTTGGGRSGNSNMFDVRTSMPLISSGAIDKRERH